MFASLEGADELGQRLDAFSGVLAEALAAKARALADALVAKVRDEKLSGGVLETRSGALKGSIAAEVSVTSDGFQASVGSYGDVKYAAIQEYGGRTAAHEIVADKGKALAFAIGGEMRFAHSVQHPGSRIPAHAYLADSLAEMRDLIVDQLTAAISEAWSQS